ncbi:MAG TPA: D-aminoacylase [Acidimicrobiales bacterium]|nr:D-aminoacylase [Acidimicrobiales bacterium]
MHGANVIVRRVPADLVIRNVRIIDGTGAPAFDGDVEVTDGRISGVGEAHDVDPGTTELDGAGHVVSPGFVDTHTHDDGALLVHPGLEFKVAQGVTTLVIGNCGSSAIPNRPGEAPPGGLLGRLGGEWTGLSGFREAVHARRPAANSIALIGHNTMRQLVMGTEKRAPTGPELAEMRGFVEQAMADGACGFSTGLIYVPGRYSDTDEVVALAEPAGAAAGVYATHMRNEADRLLEAVEEAITVGQRSGCAVHISHHKAAGQPNWGKVGDSLALVDRANAEGADVTLDVYPYTAGSGRMIEYFNLDRISTGLAEVIRLASCPAFPEYEGRMLTDIAVAEGIGLDDLVRRILTAEKGDRTLCIHFIIDEADIETNLRHPLMMIGSDGIPDLKGQPHPRLFGTYPRVLGEYVRERGVLTLEEAVRRMTSLSCDRFGLTNRGRLFEGQHADLVVFDPDTVVDTATYDDPKQEPTGIDWVIVNGEVTVDHGRHTGAGAGRLLHYRQDTA